MAKIDRARKQILHAMGKEAVRRSKPFIKSKTLRKSLTYRIKDSNTIELRFPYYWWIYVHEGTKAKKAKKRLLVWYPNSRDDPRLKGGYPKTLSQVKELTRKDFQKGIEENKRRRSLGLPPFMRYRKMVPPVPGEFFFDKALKSVNLLNQVDSTIRGSLKDIAELDKLFGRPIEATGSI
jgi:hypothetical protein|tara:strand:- start:13237 stop:13773 length:537 start_codon:yes stop_codon:yes gene_type:complete